MFFKEKKSEFKYKDGSIFGYFCMGIIIIAGITVMFGFYAGHVDAVELENKENLCAEKYDWTKVSDITISKDECYKILK